MVNNISFSTNKYKKTAFTLTELMITLMIIGLIASITIPSLINKYQDQQYTVQLRKMYSELNQAFIKMRSENLAMYGNITYLWFIPIVTSSFWDTPANSLASVMQYRKIVNNNTLFKANQYRLYKGNIYNSSPNQCGNTEKTIILNNGAYVSICLLNIEPYDPGVIFNDVYTHGIIMVDLNGEKKPNMAGMDLHSFFIVSRPQSKDLYELRPYGYPGDKLFGYTCKANAINWTQSRGCTYNRLTNPDNMP